MRNILKDLTKNKFLGKRLDIWQPSDGFRGTMDTVLLAASVDAFSGQKVLELGCGVGVGLCCLLARVPGLEAYGIEIDKRSVELCRKNLIINNLKGTIFNSDLSSKSTKINNLSFDQVFMNPPFYKKGEVKEISNQSKNIAKIESTKLESWILVAKRRCKQKGKITIIHRCDRLPEILTLLGEGFGSIKVLPLASFQKSPAKTVIIQAIKGSKEPFQLYPQKNIHLKNDRGKKVSYEKEFRKILWEGSSLDFN